MQMGIIGEKMDIDFVISVGDNFYKNGLTGVDDKTFEESFTNIYTAKSLQKPWYTSKAILATLIRFYLLSQFTN
jgi:tartrate-resistant acid phosphatase type 5